MPQPGANPLRDCDLQQFKLQGGNEKLKPEKSTTFAFGLPHNWVSEVAPDTVIPLRCRVLQFSEQFINDAFGFWPELAAFRPTLELSRRGVLFSAQTSALVGPLIKELVHASDVRVEVQTDDPEDPCLLQVDANH